MSGGCGRGRGGGQGNDGRSVRMGGWEDNKGQDYTSKRKENFDRVEAEIQAMREEYERGKAAGNDAPSHPHHPRSSQGFLDDPQRFGSNPHQDHRDMERHDGNRRNQRNWGGPTIDDVRTSMTRSRGRPPRRQQYGPPRNKMEMSMSMTGKERRDYETWRRERDEVEQQRMSRQKESSGEWRREWDREKVPGTDSWDDRRGGNRQDRGGYDRGGPPRGYRGRGRGHGRGRGRDFNNANDRRSQDSPPQVPQAPPVSQPQSAPQAPSAPPKEEKLVDPLSGPIGQWQAPARVDNWEMEISPKSKTESWLASTDSDKPSEALGVAIGQWEPPPPTSAAQDDTPVVEEVVPPLPTENIERKIADGGVDQWPASTGQVWNGTSSHADKPSSRKENELRLDHLPEPSGFSSPTSPGSMSSPRSLPTPTNLDWAACTGEADYGMWQAPEEESAFSYNYHPSEADSWKQNKSSEAVPSIPSSGMSGPEAEGQTSELDKEPTSEVDNVNASGSEHIHVADSNVNGQSDIQVNNPGVPSQEPSQGECEDTEADQAAESGSGDLQSTSQRTVESSGTLPQDAPESESAEGDAATVRWTAETTEGAKADSHDAPEAEAAEDSKEPSAGSGDTKEE